MANSTNNTDRVALSRVFVQCKKNQPKILTDFGASLQSSGGTDSEHMMIDVDWSGLAWEAGFRNHDVIEAVNAANLKMKGVSHCSLLEYLREDGQTCNMLIRRDHKDAQSTYSWIAFRVKEKGGEPVVREKAKRSVGTDINQAKRVHKELPKWALQTASSTLKLKYDSTVKIYLVNGQENNPGHYLGFFVGSEASKPRFTKNELVLNMHTYSPVYDPINGTVVAFSAVPEVSRRTMMVKKHTTGCFDRSRRSKHHDDDDDDDDRDKARTDGEACLSGDTCGPLGLSDFPSWMTGRQQILVNSRMFLWTINTDQSGVLSTANNNTDKLNVSVSRDLLPCLGTTRGRFTMIHTDASESSSTCSSLHDVDVEA